MKIFFGIFVLLHGIIHIIGFLKAFNIKTFTQIARPISKPIGILWLLSALFFSLFVILYFNHSDFSWIAGFTAVLLSQILIIQFWKETKYGTIANGIILLVSIFLFGMYTFHQRIQKETIQLLRQNKMSKDSIVTAEELKDLPKPVQQWLYHSGIVGKPYIRIGNVVQKAEMQMKPDAENWMRASAVQYTVMEPPAFLWTVDASMNSLLSFQGRDKFENGEGEMLITINSLIPVVNERGKKLDEGTIQRYLGEMVWFPSLALSPYIHWEKINDTTAQATITYNGTEGTGTFFFSSNGMVHKYSALRYKENDAQAKKYEWIMSIDDYKTFEGITVPSNMRATWKLEEGDWMWLKLEVLEIRYNENVKF
ncbi:MAG: hypothetical protein H3C35_02530 [Bacteroidetes bacterium]|nr:hypothetical protein [Bacteroidota bacterium]